MKRLAVLVCLLAVATMASAQGKMSLGGNVGIYLPMGDFGDVANTGFGILPQFEYQWKPNVNLTGTVGYVSFGGESGTLYGMQYEYSYSDMPILVGAKYYFGEGKMKPYAMAKTGLHMFKAEATVGGFSASASETYFGIDLGAGFEMPMGEKMNFDVAGGFESIFSEGESSNSLVISAGIKYFLK